MASDKILYQRPLPGGGFVNVESAPDEAGTTRAHVTVERRRDPGRRAGHRPPVIAAVEGTMPQDVFRELLEIAVDDVAVARALLRWQSDGKARF